jgi:hypothetical protein
MRMKVAVVWTKIVKDRVEDTINAQRMNAHPTG